MELRITNHDFDHCLHRFPSTALSIIKFVAAPISLSFQNVLAWHLTTLLPQSGYTEGVLPPVPPVLPVPPRTVDVFSAFSCWKFYATSVLRATCSSLKYCTLCQHPPGALATLLQSLLSLPHWILFPWVSHNGWRPMSFLNNVFTV